MQVYRIIDGKLAETWISFLPSGTAWTDAPQAHWTSPPSIDASGASGLTAAAAYALSAAELLDE